MNVFQKLAKSAENNHGLELQPRQVQELVVTLQAMQYQLADNQARSEALTRVLACSLDQHGGALDIASEMFSQAENYAVDVAWSEEGDTIRATIRVADVDVPEVQDEDAATAGSDLSGVPVQSDEGGGDADGEADEDGEG